MDILEKREYFNDVPQPGVLYRHLRNLEQDGMVTSSFEQGSGPARKVYTLTESGGEYLETWISNLRQLQSDLNRFLTDVTAE